MGSSIILLYEPSGPAFRGLGIVVVNRAPATNVVIHGKHIGGRYRITHHQPQFFEDLGAVALIWTGVRRCDSSIDLALYARL